MREVVVEKYEIGKEVKLPMEPVIGCTCTCRWIIFNESLPITWAECNKSVVGGML
jgi:hypothetical protein